MSIEQQSSVTQALSGALKPANNLRFPGLAEGQPGAGPAVSRQLQYISNIGQARGSQWVFD